MHKSSVLILIAAIAIFSHPLKSSAQDFRIIKATSQRWIAGIRGGGGGYNYQIIVLAGKDSKKLQISDIWVGEKNFHPTYLVTNKPANTPRSEEKKFSKNDTLIIKFTDFQRGERLADDNPNKITRESNDSLRIPPPFNYKGEALMTYTSGKKKKNLVVEKFEKLSTLSYP